MRNAGMLGVLMAVVLLAGCVDRRFVITSDPPGALVLNNNQPIGATPADDHFTYYGKYDFTLFRDGYEPLKVAQDVPTPWYEYPPLDFISENLIPWTISDIRRYHYQMQPLRVPRSDEVIQRAQELRERGKVLGPLPTDQ